MDDVAVIGYGAAASVHIAFAAYLWLGKRLEQEQPALTAAVVAALLCTAAWAGVSAADARYASPVWPAGAALLDVARYGCWYSLLLLLIGRPRTPHRDALLPSLRLGLIVVALACLGLQAVQIVSGDPRMPPARLLGTAMLALPIGGVLLLEQLFRNQNHDSYWNSKPFCLGLACVFGFDLYFFSSALMFGAVDPDAHAVRGAAHLLAVPFLLISARRRSDWIARMQVSRRLAFHSATLVLAGVYLLFMSAIGYYLRLFGGTWGRALQISLLFTALAALVALALSGSLRAKLRVFVGKHFFSYRFDYREEWLRFTATLSTHGAANEVGLHVIRGLADLVECPAGSLWTRSDPQGPYVQNSRWNLPSVVAEEPADSPFCSFLRQRAWVIDLEEFRAAPHRQEGLVLPRWLLDMPSAWLAVPLITGDQLLGFALLAKPRTRIELDWEVLDLLKTASRQAASYLAQMCATEALLEVRKFDAFNRMSAFVVHDLKNIVTQLSLMLKNAERLHDNREFQQDMLLTVQSSLEKMKRLMLQLREGATPPRRSSGVELEPIVSHLQSLALSQGRRLEVTVLERLATRGHDERLERVLGHLVQNALDATPPSGRVWVGVERYSGQVMIEIGDTGGGMSEDFIKTRLFKPFHTTKHNGMGVGTYESHQYVRELGGSIAVESEPGHGTVMTVLLPLFDRTRGSDLMPLDPA